MKLTIEELKDSLEDLTYAAAAIGVPASSDTLQTVINNIHVFYSVNSTASVEYLDVTDKFFSILANLTGWIIGTVGVYKMFNKTKKKMKS